MMGPSEQRVRGGIDPREDYTDGERQLLRARLAEARADDMSAEVERLRAAISVSDSEACSALSEETTSAAAHAHCARVLAVLALDLIADGGTPDNAEDAARMLERAASEARAAAMAARVWKPPPTDPDAPPF